MASADNLTPQPSVSSVSSVASVRCLSPVPLSSKEKSADHSELLSIVIVLVIAVVLDSRSPPRKPGNQTCSPNPSTSTIRG